MTTRGAKAKGRRAQNAVVAGLRERIYLPHGLVEDDVKPVTMGIPGKDVILSPAARAFLDLAIECKNVENLNVTTTFWDHVKKGYSGLNLLVHKRNNTELLATLKWEDLLDLLRLRVEVTGGDNITR